MNEFRVKIKLIAGLYVPHTEIKDGDELTCIGTIGDKLLLVDDKGNLSDVYSQYCRKIS